MSEAAGDLNLERLLTDALRPVDPPADLSTLVESTLSAIAEQAAAQLSSWPRRALRWLFQALRDPRNWVRPVAGLAVGGAAAGALVLVEMRRRRRPLGLPLDYWSPAARASVAQARRPVGAPLGAAGGVRDRFESVRGWARTVSVYAHLSGVDRHGSDRRPRR